METIKFLNEMTCRGSTQANIRQIDIDGVAIDDSLIIANKFNSFFHEYWAWTGKKNPVNR